MKEEFTAQGVKLLRHNFFVKIHGRRGDRHIDFQKYFSNSDSGIVICIAGI